MKKCYSFLTLLLCVFLIPTSALAGVGGSDVPTVTSPVTVGQLGLNWSFTITNTSTNPNDANNIRILVANNIFFTTACGTPDPDGTCNAANQEAINTITISPLTATGQPGTACAGIIFNVASTATPNEYVFTPPVPVILGPSNVGGLLATCQVNFTVNINAAPVHDSSASAGLQTSQLARVIELEDVNTAETGSAAGTSTVTITIPPPPPPGGGECPYIAIVGNDADANAFYFSAKHQQFMYEQGKDVCAEGSTPLSTPQTRVGAEGCEQFRSNPPINQPEICDTKGTVNGVGDFTFFGEPNAVIRKQNAGYFEWWIRLPRKPDGEINIVFQCGILKPNAFAPFGFEAIDICAAESGERIEIGFCNRVRVKQGISPIVIGALPKITAIAYPGPNSLYFEPFHLTTYKNPGSYILSGGQQLTNSASLQVLDGSASTRVLLKACMDETVVAKIPVTGQINALREEEADLEAGDLIQVRMDVPISNTVDIYCHAQSVRLAGIGLCD